MKEIEKVRVKEVTEEDINDTEARELINRILRCINRSYERLEQFHEGNISIAEINKERKEDDKELREIKRRFKNLRKRLL